MSLMTKSCCPLPSVRYQVQQITKYWCQALLVLPSHSFDSSTLVGYKGSYAVSTAVLLLFAQTPCVSIANIFPPRSNSFHGYVYNSDRIPSVDQHVRRQYPYHRKKTKPKQNTMPPKPQTKPKQPPKPNPPPPPPNNPPPKPPQPPKTGAQPKSSCPLTAEESSASAPSNSAQSLGTKD